MPEAEIPRVDTGTGLNGDPQDAQQGVPSDFDRVRGDAAETGKNMVRDELESSLNHYYGRSNPKIMLEIENRKVIIQKIVAKNTRNSENEILGTKELMAWAGESPDQIERIIRAYSIYLYLEEEINRIPGELKERKRDYIVFLKERIGRLLDAIPSKHVDKPTRLGKMLPIVRKYALAVTSVVALGSLGYAKHLKSENSGIRSDYTQTSGLLQNERQISSNLSKEVQKLRGEKISIEQEQNSIVKNSDQSILKNVQEQESLRSKNSRIQTSWDKDRLLLQDQYLINTNLKEEVRKLQEGIALIVKQRAQDAVKSLEEKKQLNDQNNYLRTANDEISAQNQNQKNTIRDMSERQYRLVRCGMFLQEHESTYDKIFKTKEDAVKYVVNPDDDSIILKEEHKMYAWLLKFMSPTRIAPEK